MIRSEISKLFLCFLLFIPLGCMGQGGVAYWIGGGITSSLDGVPATDAIIHAWDLTTDNAGNIYFVDSATKIKKIDAVSGLVTTIAGTGMMVNAGDGGPASVASLSAKGHICTDPVGNIYFSDDDFRVRKINMSSGIISTIAGASVGYSGDGGPATAAAMNHPYGICCDGAGNIYVTNVNAVRKIEAATGVISTVCSGFETIGVCTDNAGNLYVSGNDRIRKVNLSTGVVTLFAGNGSPSYSGDGGLATAAGMPFPRDIVINHATGKMYVLFLGMSTIREIDMTSGIIRQIVGGTGSCFTFPSPMFQYLAIHPAGDLLFSVPGAPACWEIWSAIPFVASSINITSTQYCMDVTFRIAVDTFISGMSVTSYFGDGTSVSTPLTAASSCVSGQGSVTHTYEAPGVYTLKHVLMNGAVRLDSVVSNYTHLECNATQLRFYNDADNDCIRDTNEHYVYAPIKIKVDSNGVVIDTITSTGGVYYYRSAPVGTIYSYSILPTTLSLYASCPSSGMVYDTIGVNPYSVKQIGMQCSSTSNYDLGVYGLATLCGTHVAFATTMVINASCMPVVANLDLANSKYSSVNVTGPFSGAPLVHSYGVGWNTASISALSKTPLFTHPISIGSAPYLSIGDKVPFTFDGQPVAADADVSNNMVIFEGTVRASYDPNIIAVNKTCFDDDGAELQYTVHFENMGNDTAYNVHVMDTLSNNLDPNSFEIVATSAEMFSYQYKSGPYNIIKFDFPNIKLLDSSWHGLNNGMFVYKMKTRSWLPANTIADAKVGIYFDHNEVVMTNTVSSVKGCPLNTSEVSQLLSSSLFPNPTTGELTIKTDGQTFSSFTITNAVGQQVWQQGIGKARERVELGHLPAGVYYVTLRGEQGSEVRKFVKW